jgi:hypothetical protein
MKLEEFEPGLRVCLSSNKAIRGRSGSAWSKEGPSPIVKFDDSSTVWGGKTVFITEVNCLLFELEPLN